MENFTTYLVGVAMEGALLGVLFWVITLITVESTSLVGALRSAFIAEAVGNIPYLWGLPATTPPGLLMSLVAAFIFIRLIMRIGELTAGKAFYGVAMTYFVLIALVTCNA
ncbi:MAG: hypothetical protein NXH95_11675 [Pseudomonadaceae bacterium]|nr:hypothetical protein [Pseudomonadaceae bacterium]